MRHRLMPVAFGLALAAGTSWALVAAQQNGGTPAPQYKRLTGASTKNPGDWPQHFPYPDAYDSVFAAPEVHHARYEDEHVRLVEVAYFPGVKAKMHGHPWPSVFAQDAPAPKAMNVSLDPERRPITGRGPAPEGLQWPTCMTMGPQAPHAETNQDTWPHHFWRIEFKRIDGDDIRTKWKEWYPFMLLPLKPIANIDPKDPKLGPPVSKQYPYAASTESYKAAPNNHQLRFENDQVLFLEVTIRPGERENLHGHAYPSVFANDTGGTAPAAPGATPAAAPPPPPTPPVNPPENIPGIGHGAGGDWKLEPNGVNGQGGGQGPAPEGFRWPRCSTMGPQWPHAAGNNNTTPSHFYRIQFKRIDGDGLKDHWAEWYPWMVTQVEEYKKNPFPVNY